MSKNNKRQGRLGALWELLVTHMPGPTGLQMRRRYWGKRLGHMGKNVRIDPGVYITNPEYVHLYDGCWVDRGVMLLAGPDKSDRPRVNLPNPGYEDKPGELHVGKQVHLGPFSLVIAAGGVRFDDLVAFAGGVRVFSFTNHGWSEFDPGNRDYISSPRGPHEYQFMIEGPVRLERNVVVAAQAIVLPGVHVGPDSGIMLNTVVNQSFPENSLIAAGPHGYGQRIRERFVSKPKAKASKSDKPE
ncbi:MAG: hypothetical protein ACPGQL_03715 [Thermoplasmatota archaeon]